MSRSIRGHFHKTVSTFWEWQELIWNSLLKILRLDWCQDWPKCWFAMNNFRYILQTKLTESLTRKWFFIFPFLIRIIKNFKNLIFFIEQSALLLHFQHKARKGNAVRDENVMTHDFPQCHKYLLADYHKNFLWWYAFGIKSKCIII